VIAVIKKYTETLDASEFASKPRSYVIAEEFRQIIDLPRLDKERVIKKTMRETMSL